MKKIQSSTKLYCGSRSTYIFIYVTFCQSVSISIQVWIDFCGYIWIWNFQCHILLFCFFFPKKKSPPIYFKILLPLPYFAAYWEKSISKMFPPNFEKACSKCQVGCFRIKRQTASRVLLPLSWNLWQPDQKFHFQLKLFVLNLKFTLLLKQGGLLILHQNISHQCNSE